MSRKHLKKTFRFSIMVLFVTFFVLFISQSAGYVEFENSKKARLTEKQIKKFEADIAAGKQIDLETYIETTNKNYQNKISRAGLKLSNIGSGSVKRIVDKSFKFLSKLAE